MCVRRTETAALLYMRDNDLSVINNKVIRNHRGVQRHRAICLIYTALTRSIIHHRGHCTFHIRLCRRRSRTQTHWGKLMYQFAKKKLYKQKKNIWSVGVYLQCVFASGWVAINSMGHGWAFSSWLIFIGAFWILGTGFLWWSSWFLPYFKALCCTLNSLLVSNTLLHMTIRCAFHLAEHMWALSGILIVCPF